MPGFLHVNIGEMLHLVDMETDAFRGSCVLRPTSMFLHAVVPAFRDVFRCGQGMNYR